MVLSPSLVGRFYITILAMSSSASCYFLAVFSLRFSSIVLAFMAKSIDLKSVFLFFTLTSLLCISLSIDRPSPSCLLTLPYMSMTLLPSFCILQKLFYFARWGSDIFPVHAYGYCHLGFGCVYGVRGGKKALFSVLFFRFLVGLYVGGLSGPGWLLDRLLGVPDVLLVSVSRSLVSVVIFSWFSWA